MKFAPIIVTVYTRIDHFKQCIRSLKNNYISLYSEIYIVSDAASQYSDVFSVNTVREYAKTIDGFKEVHLLFWDTNLGSEESFKKSVKKVLERHDYFIYMEDDIVVSNNFLQYLNDGLQFYKNNKRVFSICAFKLPFQLPVHYNKEIYFHPCLSPWGIAIWKDRYEDVNEEQYDRYSELKKNSQLYQRFMSVGFFIKGILIEDSKGKVNAGDVRWYYHMVKNNMYSVFPSISKSQNWGFDGTGLHCDNKKAWWAKPELDIQNKSIVFEPFTAFDEKLLLNCRKFQDKINGGTIAKYLKYTWVHRVYKRMKHFNKSNTYT
jgi:hypothetical protein